MLHAHNARRGMTLVELLTTIMLVAAALGVFYAIFVTNWLALEGYIARTELWGEASDIISGMTVDGLVAKSINVTNNPGIDKRVLFSDIQGNQIAEYTMLPDGTVQRQDGAGATKTLSTNVIFNESDFQNDGVALKMTLSLQESVFTQTIKIVTENDVFPRNYLN